MRVRELHDQAAPSTYLGGSDIDGGAALGRDSLGKLYVAGLTLSGDFPVTFSAFQFGNGAFAEGTTNAFVTVLDPSSGYMAELMHTGGEEALRGLVLGEQGRRPKWFLSTTITSLSALQFTPPLSAVERDPKKRKFLAYAAAGPDSKQPRKATKAGCSLDHSAAARCAECRRPQLSLRMGGETAMLSTRTVTEPGARAHELWRLAPSSR